MKYINKLNQIKVDAFKWTGGPDQTEDPEWIVEAIKNKDVFFAKKDDGEVIMCINIHGATVVAPVGSMIYRTSDGYINFSTEEQFNLSFDKEDE